MLRQLHQIVPAWLWPRATVVTMPDMTQEAAFLSAAYACNSCIWSAGGQLTLDNWCHVVLPADRLERIHLFNIADVDPDAWSFLESWLAQRAKELDEVR